MQSVAVGVGTAVLGHERAIASAGTRYDGATCAKLAWAWERVAAWERCEHWSMWRRESSAGVAEQCCAARAREHGYLGEQR